MGNHSKVFVTVWGVLLCVSNLTAAELNISRERYFPTDWTEPEIHSTGDSTFIKPSTPSGFEKRNMGTGLETGDVSVQYDYDRKQVPKSYKVRLRDGRTIEVRKGQKFWAGKRYYKVLGIRGDALLILDLKTGKRLRFGKDPQSKD